MNLNRVSFRLLHIAAMLAVLGTSSAAVAENFTSPGAVHAQSTYELAIQKAKKDYLAQLQVALRESTQSGQLAEANRISKVIEQLKEDIKLSARQGGFPNLQGAWVCWVGGKNVGQCRIEQDGVNLTFVNENGVRTGGLFEGNSVVKTKKWERWGDEGAKITDGGRRIEWSSGSVWMKSEK